MPGRTAPHRYVVQIEGWDSVSIHARSASAARYAAFKSLREAGWKLEFRDFLARCRVLHMGRDYA